MRTLSKILISSQGLYLVLICSSVADLELGCKMKACCFRLMVIIRRSHNGAYCLAKLDGTVLKLHYATFHLVPYFSHSCSTIPITHILECEDLVAAIEEEANVDLAEEVDWGWSNFQPPGRCNMSIHFGLKKHPNTA
jgi:hypothetical protein